MFPSEAIQVLENSPSGVVILDPPYYSFGAYMFFLALCSGGLAYFLYHRQILASLVPMLAVLALALAGFGSFLFTSKRLISLSRSDGMLRVERSKWGVKSLESTLALNQIRRTTVGSVRFNNFIVVVMQSGESFKLTDGSNRKGYYGAVDAINHFLGVSGE